MTVGAAPGMAGAAALPDAAGPTALPGCSMSGRRHSLWQSLQDPAHINKNGIINVQKGGELLCMQHEPEPDEGCNTRGCSDNPWRYIFFNLGTGSNDRRRERRRSKEKPLRIKMESFQENIGQKCYLVLMPPSSANGVVSRMPSQVGGDTLEYKSADSLMVEDQLEMSMDWSRKLFH